MTVIACRVTKNGFTIAADSQATRAWTQTTDTQRISKIFKTNGMIVGSAGTAEETFLFQTFLKTHKPKRCSAEAWLDLKAEFSDWKSKKMGDRALVNSSIIGYKGKAFYCEPYMVSEIVTYEAIGSGMEYALTALYLGHSARKAVEVAIELNIYCEYPIKSFKYKRSESK